MEKRLYPCRVLVRHCLEEYAAELRDAVFRHQATVRRHGSLYEESVSHRIVSRGQRDAQHNPQEGQGGETAFPQAVNRAVTPGGQRPAFSSLL